MSELTDNLITLGVSIPADLTAVLELQQAARETVLAPPASTIRADLAAGKLTPGNVGKKITEAAMQIASRDAARGVLKDLEYSFNAPIAAAVRDNAVSILDSVRPLFDEAATAVHAADFDPDATADEIITAGGAAADAYNALGRHVAILDVIHSVRVDLARHGYGPGMPIRAAWYVTELADDADRAKADGLLGNSRGRGGRWHRLAHAGYRLTLNTAEQSAAVLSGAAATDAKVAADVAAAEREQAMRENRAEQAMIDAFERAKVEKAAAEERARAEQAAAFANYMSGGDAA